MTSDSNDTMQLLERARAGEGEAINDLLRLHRARLLRMVRTRLNPRIRGRVDESDVVQETYLETAKRLPEYLAEPRAPFFLWLRQITGHRIIDVHRRHLGAQARNADMEISLDTGGRPIATSLCLAAQLLGQLTTPSQVLVRAETRAALQDAINATEPQDREILALRHFEELSNG